MNWVKVAGKEILQQNDFICAVKAGNKSLCLIRQGDQLYASQAYCPHAGAALFHGWCKNGKLICPHHRYEYDLLSGRGNPGQGDYIDVYPVEVRADGVYIGLPEQYGFLRKLFRS